MEVSLQHEPTPEELAEETGLDPDEVEAILRSAETLASLDKPVGEEDEASFGDFIADDRAEEEAFEKAHTAERNDALQDALFELSDREHEILGLRYGLYDGRNWTLDQVGKHLGITRERVRQLEEKAMEKIRTDEENIFFKRLRLVAEDD